MVDETRIDLRKQSPEDIELTKTQAQLIFKFNHTMPYTPDYEKLMREIFPTMGSGSVVNAQLIAIRPHMVEIGKNVYIMNGALMMAAGGIIIDDDVKIAANVHLLTNNHDLNDRPVITCKPIHICRNVWIGAGSTILPGVTIGENSVVGAASVVTKDVPDNVK